MDEDTLKLEFKKQVSSLLDEISKLDTDLASIINEKYTILTDDHIEEFNNNISPYINEIIVQNSSIFEEDEIELFEDISLSNLWEKLSADDKVIIFKYLQTIYLISNVYNRDNQSKEIHKMMKQIKSSIKEFDNIDSELLDDSSDDTKTDDTKSVDNSSENTTMDISKSTSKSKSKSSKKKNKSKKNTQPDVSNMMKGLEGMFGNGGGDNNILKMAMEMSQEIMSDPNFSIEKIMKGDGNSLSNMMGNISEKIDTKYQSGELDKDKIEKDAADFMGNMKNNPMFNNLMNQMNNMNHKQKRKVTRKMNKNK